MGRGLDFQSFEVRFAGLAEHTDPKTQIAGALDVCENAVFTKLGRISKRYGYGLVPVLEDIEGEDIDPRNLFVNGASVHGELVVVGYDRLFSLVSRVVAFGSGHLVPKGPTFRGNVRVFTLSTGSLSSDPNVT